MTDLITEQAITEEITITIGENGHGTITARGAARLLGISNPTLSAVRFPKKLAEILTQQGIDPAVRPFSEVALTLIAEYYAYRAQKTTEQAQQVYRTLAAIGVRTWMQKVKGWTPEPKEIAPSKPRMPISAEKEARYQELFKRMIVIRPDGTRHPLNRPDLWGKKHP